MLTLHAPGVRIIPFPPLATYSDTYSVTVSPVSLFLGTARNAVILKQSTLSKINVLGRAVYHVTAPRLDPYIVFLLSCLKNYFVLDLTSCFVSVQFCLGIQLLLLIGLFPWVFMFRFHCFILEIIPGRWRDYPTHSGCVYEVFIRTSDACRRLSDAHKAVWHFQTFPQAAK